MYKCWTGAENRKDGDRLLVVLSERTRGNGHNMQKTKYSLEKAFFTVRVIKHWNRLLKGVEESASLEIAKTQPDTLLRNLL